MKRKINIAFVGHRVVYTQSKSKKDGVLLLSCNTSTITKTPIESGQIVAAALPLTADELADAEDYFEQVLGG